MPKNTYTEQFKRDAVALYENTPGASMKTIAAELGINRNTLKNWAGGSDAWVTSSSVVYL